VKHIELDAQALDFGLDHQATEYARKHGIDTVEHSFAVANILHMHGRVRQAAYFYHHAYAMHSGSPHEYPLAQSLLQAHLLCLLKAREPLPAQLVEALGRLNLPYQHYILGVERAWAHEDYWGALQIMGNCFEEFHTGEEVDRIYLETAKEFFRFASMVGDTEWVDRRFRIPNVVYMYWDQNPPEEIQANIDYHSRAPGIGFKIFSREEAAQWLYEMHGVETRSLFLEARHPAEAADFLRVHVIHALGGWWLDADLRMKQPQHLGAMVPPGRENILFLARDNQVHNDFFGACANSALLSDCMMSLYRNCHRHRDLYIAFKTGPGIFMRALNRGYRAAFRGQRRLPLTKLYDHQQFNNFIEEFPTPYKETAPTWHMMGR
jgi:hypothetical protein